MSMGHVSARIQNVLTTIERRIVIAGLIRYLAGRNAKMAPSAFLYVWKPPAATLVNDALCLG